MSKKQKMLEEQQSQQQSARKMSVGYVVVNPRGIPTPVARPTQNIQLTPIVQPIALVPFSSQEQPILSDYDDYDY